MKKIGILGGTFNPIHSGHLKIAEDSYHQLQLDEIWLMPNGIPPHKNKTDVAPDDFRVLLIQAAIEDYPYMKCSDLELQNPGASYTAETLALLKQKYPDTELYYIVGSDSLCYMEHWYHPEQIFSLAYIVAAYRPSETMEEMEAHARFLEEKYHARILFVHNQAMDISSSEIRRKYQNGEDLQGLLPEKVLHLLYERGGGIYDRI